MEVNPNGILGSSIACSTDSLGGVAVIGGAANTLVGSVMGGIMVHSSNVNVAISIIITIVTNDVFSVMGSVVTVFSNEDFVIAVGNSTSSSASVNHSDTIDIASGGLSVNFSVGTVTAGNVIIVVEGIR